MWKSMKIQDGSHYEKITVDTGIHRNDYSNNNSVITQKYEEHV